MGVRAPGTIYQAKLANNNQGRDCGPARFAAHVEVPDGESRQNSAVNSNLFAFEGRAACLPACWPFTGARRNVVDAPLARCRGGQSAA